jgi:hypothetical protein
VINVNSFYVLIRPRIINIITVLLISQVTKRQMKYSRIVYED